MLKPRGLEWGARAAILAASVLVMALPAAAQQWTGSVGVGYVWQTSDGNQGAFLTQTGLEEGLVLEELALALSEDGGGQRFSLHAWGFGGAEPSEHGALTVELGGQWSAELGYDRRESFFRLAGGDLAGRNDGWEITRWRGALTWDGWSAARLTLGLRHTDRGGTVHRPLYGLNELYRARVALDESMDEASFRIETKTLPVHITFEQSLASYERSNRYRPDGASAGGDPDLLADVATTFNDEQDVPTTRLGLSYASPAVAVVANVLWSSADLGGGGIGTVRFFDELVGSATTDTLAGGVQLAVALGGAWRLNLHGSYRDAASDSALLGTRILNLGNPSGTAFDISAPIDDNGRFDFTSPTTDATIEYRGQRWAVWAGGLVGSRDVSWTRTADDPGEDVTRDTDGVLAGASLRIGSRLDGSLEYRHGTFEEYVFRTDPETVDRTTLRVRSKLGKGFSLTVHGRFESADNPASQSALDHSSSAGGFSLAWADADGTTAAGFTTSLVDLETRTGLVLPGGTPGLSRYDLSLLTLSAFGRATLGKVHLDGSVTRIDDSGATWPVSSWNAALRVGLDLTTATRIAAFARYWSYDEDRRDLDDFDVTRYGVALTWSF